MRTLTPETKDREEWTVRDNIFVSIEKMMSDVQVLESLEGSIQLMIDWTDPQDIWHSKKSIEERFERAGSYAKQAQAARVEAILRGLLSPSR